MNNTFTVPSIVDLQRISDQYGFQCTDSDLHTYKNLLHGSIQSFNTVWNLPEPVPLVKYPRTPGYRPSAVENPYNAWYWRCSIQGANTGKLSGKKVAIKDNILVAGVPMMNGSRSLEGFVPEHDATVVSKVLDAGAEIIGKTTVPDLCISGASYMTALNPVSNPWNSKFSAGGSSSGNAVVIATGCADMAIGGDQGGSVRIPASSCGIVGLKPTFGMIPYTGAAPADTTIDHLGPMTRNVKDCALMMEVLAVHDNGADGRQPDIGYPQKNLDFLNQLEQPSSGLRVGVLLEGYDSCESDVVETVKTAVAALKASNKFAVVEDVSVPMHSNGKAIHTPVAFLGTVHQMMDGGGYGTGMTGSQSSRLSDMTRDHSQILQPFT